VKLMANQEHLDVLKKGVKVWNQWRNENPKIEPDLSKADLRNADLNGANLRSTKLVNAILDNAKLTEADLGKAYLNEANLYRTDLSRANLNGAHLFRAILEEVDLSRAYAHEATFRQANLSYANLSGADLSGVLLLFVDLSYANFKGATLNEAKIGSTKFVNVDLSQVLGLNTVKHYGPSSIGIDTIYRSQGQIPETFLRNAGVPKSFLEIMASITNHPLEYYTVFISYSSKDEAFTKHLHVDLQNHGVRCWFAPEDLKIGDKIRPRVDESIRIYDKLLLVLSKHSVASQWVEQEVETALERERKGNRAVLFPMRLDDAVMDIEGGWPALIRNTRHIGDFREWQDGIAYQRALQRLLRDLHV
jgi:hypothetical protein